MKKLDTFDVFFSRIKKTNYCWFWLGTKIKKGYGLIISGRSQIFAHRFSWEVHNQKPVPEDMFVLHKCDNPPCVNPDHLYVGTIAQNMRDRDERKRGWPAKLTHCKYGHEFNPENTVFIKNMTYGANQRRCKLCLKEYARKRWQLTLLSRIKKVAA